MIGKSIDGMPSWPIRMYLISEFKGMSALCDSVPARYLSHFVFEREPWNARRDKSTKKNLKYLHKIVQILNFRGEEKLIDGTKYFFL